MTEQEDRLSSQAGTVRLDAFTHCLVAKCGPEVRRWSMSFGAKGNEYWFIVRCPLVQHYSSLLTRPPSCIILLGLCIGITICTLQVLNTIKTNKRIRLSITRVKLGYLLFKLPCWIFSSSNCLLLDYIHEDHNFFSNIWDQALWFEISSVALFPYHASLPRDKGKQKEAKSVCVKISCIIWAEIKDNEKNIEKTEVNETKDAFTRWACILASKFLSNAKLSVVLWNELDILD